MGEEKCNHKIQNTTQYLKTKIPIETGQEKHDACSRVSGPCQPWRATGTCVLFIQLVMSLGAIYRPHYMKVPYDRVTVAMESWLSKKIGKVVHQKKFFFS